jgi:competence protein ComEC
MKGISLEKKMIRRCSTAALLIFIMFAAAGCGIASSTLGSSVSAKPSAETAQRGSGSAAGTLKVHFIDVGQGDSILVQQGSESMLVDAGPNASSTAVEKYIASLGITNLTYVVGTHPHEDHIGGLDRVIDSFGAGRIYMPKVSANTKTFEDVLTAISRKGMKITAPVAGDSFSLGNAVVEILAPNSSGYDSLNNYSIVLKVTYGSTSFLLEGDAQSLSESEMISRGFDLRADVLKVGHHGSASSTTKSFLSRVDPEYAVISVGAGNTYGHPAQKTLEKLEAKGVTVYRTDESGTTIATSDGRTISFETSK